MAQTISPASNAHTVTPVVVVVVAVVVVVVVVVVVLLVSLRGVTCGIVVSVCALGLFSRVRPFGAA